MGRTLERFIIIWLLVLLTIWVGQDAVYRVLFPAEPRVVSPRADLTEAEASVIELFQAVSPSVASIIAAQPGRSLRAGQISAGSGFVWDSLGHIVTNDHVVGGAEKVAVRLSADTLYPAEVIGRAPDYDLAVLRVTSRNAALQPIAIGSSADLAVGQTAFAIGNPYGLSRTLTQGIISAIDRVLPTGELEVRGVIQTDAAINPGNSGGPLLDSAGRLIGVNTAIISGSGSSAGIGFAVPVDLVNRVVPELIRNGYVARHGIGITALREDLAARLDVEGIVIAEVVPGSPAEQAGLVGADFRAGTLGDVIVAVNGVPVRSVPDLATELAAVPIGETVELTVENDGRRRRVEVVVTDITGLRQVE